MDLRHQVNNLSRLAYQMRGLATHPCHEDLKTLKNRYTESIKATKKQHWIDWLENIEGNDLWTAKKYISSDPKDGGKTRIPSLKIRNLDGTTTEANTNQDKSLLIAKSFFPLPPVDNLVPPDAIYPDPVEPHTPFTSAEITHAILKLNGLKAPGPDSICNIVYKQCTKILTPYLTHLFNAAFTL